MSEGAPKVAPVEGTLSLLEWREESVPAEMPTEARAVSTAMRTEMATGSAPVTQAPRIVVFDCETTGTDRTKDQVIELCVQQGLGEGAPSRVWRILPSAPIHPGAQAVHGIAMEDLASCPRFDAIADEITEVFANADVLVGYNLAFDMDMLHAEYTRIGKPLIDFTSKVIVDAFRLWQQFEPRSLMHAHKKFVGEQFEAAHTASADVAATGRVLSGMLRHFGLEGQDWEQIACKADPQRLKDAAERAFWVGPSRHLRWEGEQIIIGFGKYTNAALHEIAAGPDRSFLQWVISKDFPLHVGEVCKAALELPSDQFLAWARERYPTSVTA
ncbi:hypothetical protein BH11MYX2_BH11MYX2_10560 [soil metagenome]